MSSRRILLIAGLAAVIASVAGFVVWRASQQPGITAENAQRLRRGMMIDEVSAVFGEKELLLCDDRIYGEEYVGCTTAFWDNGDLHIGANFDKDGKLNYATAVGVDPRISENGLLVLTEPDSLIDRLRRSLGL